MGTGEEVGGGVSDLFGVFLNDSGKYEQRLSPTSGFPVCALLCPPLTHKEFS